MSPTTPPADIPPPEKPGTVASGERRALFDAEAAAAEAADPIARKAGALAKLAKALFGEGPVTWARASVLISLIFATVAAGLVFALYFWGPDGLEARVKTLEDNQTRIKTLEDNQIPAKAIEGLTASNRVFTRNLNRLECIVVRTRNPITAPTVEADCLDRYPREE